MSMQLGEATIGTGSSGDEVRKIQQTLQGQGYNVGPIDGLFGPQTQTAVQAFQRAHGLIPDGIVGPLTWNALQGQPVAPAPTLPAPMAPRPGGSGAFAFLDKMSIPMLLAGGVALLLMFPASKRKSRR